MRRYEVALRAGLTLAEGPFWDIASGALWVIDVEAAAGGGAVYRLDPRTGSLTVRPFDGPVGTAVPAVGDEMVIGLADGLYAAGWAEGDERLLAGIEHAHDPTVRVNDAKCDPRGRLFAGTIPIDFRAGISTLYRLGTAGAVPVVRDLAMANGLGWSPAGDTMYLADSRVRRVLAFDYDVETGSVSERRTWVQMPEKAGFPDGLAVDAEGAVWVAAYLGGAVHRYDADGTLVDVVELPVAKVTSVCFGGDGLTDLYVTTSRAGLTEEQLREQPSAGDVLVVPGAGRGLPGVRFDPATLQGDHARPPLPTGGL
ncbi:SMP-30/gluconolactonase/LRE family protein [Streptomyces sp. NPDC001982]|uniref:SMP-30/gluconolactonase/LRE family protein n=1 Tax=Streptomyces sp. NPDC001982 TaxID=3154405 RepID=UPI00332D304D